MRLTNLLGKLSEVEINVKTTRLSKQARGQLGNLLWESRGHQDRPGAREPRSRVQREAEPQKAGGRVGKHLPSLYSTEGGGGPEGIFRDELL